MGDPGIKDTILSKKLLAKRTSDVHDKSWESIALSISCLMNFKKN